MSGGVQWRTVISGVLEIFSRQKQPDIRVVRGDIVCVSLNGRWFVKIQLLPATCALTRKCARRYLLSVSCPQGASMRAGFRRILVKGNAANVSVALGAEHYSNFIPSHSIKIAGSLGITSKKTGLILTARGRRENRIHPVIVSTCLLRKYSGA